MTCFSFAFNLVEKWYWKRRTQFLYPFVQLFRWDLSWPLDPSRKFLNLAPNGRGRAERHLVKMANFWDFSSHAAYVEGFAKFWKTWIKIDRKQKAAELQDFSILNASESQRQLWIFLFHLIYLITNWLCVFSCWF